MAKITISPITGSFASVTQLNAYFQRIEDELNDKVLYRDNPVSEPNSMSNDIDMDSNDLFNAASVSTTSLTVNGVAISSADDLLNNPSASQVVNVPAGSIAATDVQAALNELDTEKEPVFSKNTAFNKDFGTSAGEVSEGNHTHTPAQVGLGNVDNTSDANKPISTAQQTALDLKADTSDLLGEGQTWQDVSGSRAANVTYTNSTGKAILVCVSSGSVTGGDYLLVDGTHQFLFDGVSGSAVMGTVFIPDGSTYLYTDSFLGWMELR